MRSYKSKNEWRIGGPRDERFAKTKCSVLARGTGRRRERERWHTAIIITTILDVIQIPAMFALLCTRMSSMEMYLHRNAIDGVRTKVDEFDIKGWL